MDRAEVSLDVHDHGTLVDRKRQRVKCNYCGKQVSGYTRLKQHLGGIRGDVLPCLEVPENVKLQMKSIVLERHNEMVKREVVQLLDSDTPLKSDSYSNSSDQKRNHLKSVERHFSKKRQHIISDSSSDEEDDHQVLSRRKLDSHTPKSYSVEDDSLRQAQRSVGRFFLENGIDFNAAKSATFQKMIRSLVGSGSTQYKGPSSDDLKGWILEEETKAIQEYVEEVKSSWGRTGCSILLDGWTDNKGRNLIMFLVDCPRGPIFLKSADISNKAEDVDAMVLLLSGVIEEVGVENVVQIVTYTTLNPMVAVGKILADKYRSIFFTFCASHCIGLMLDKIGTMDLAREVLSKVKTITRFIYSRESLLKLMKKHTFGEDLVSFSRIGFAVPFLTLEKIERGKKNLERMFSSSSWRNSAWASTTDGRKVARLVGDSSFWAEARMLIKASTPLIRSLHLINGGDNKPQLGYIYETMDQVKETIKEEYNNKKAKYMPFWNIIDEIWDNQLHSPLHSAAYFLNPSLRYSSDFSSDAEVECGLFCCIVRMVEDKQKQDLVIAQLHAYGGAIGSFGKEAAIDQRTKLTPAMWWSLHGGQYPELQKIATRVLCQTCTGALKYGLKRSLSEQFHNNERSKLEQERLKEMIFVRHNLKLYQYSNGDYSDIFAEEIEQINEWVVDEIVEQNDEGNS